MTNRGIEFEISDFLGDFEVTEATIEKIEKLEDYIQQANTLANMKTGEVLVVDAIYDQMVSLLKQVNPESPLLTELWETEDDSNVLGNEYARLLEQNPMKSIQTIKSFDGYEMQEFQRNYPEEPVTLHCSLKLNGWGVRLVYEDGDFVSATTRARSSAGRDITKQMRVVLGKQGLLRLPDDEISGGLVEIRGELVLPYSNLDKAREYNSSIVSAFSGVASMVRESATEEENALLDFIAYKVIMDGFTLDGLSEMYEYLEEDLNFTVPIHWRVDLVEKEELVSVLEEVIEEISEDVFGDEPYNYFSDGVVVQVDSYDIFHSMGDGDKFDFGNIALKVGSWSQDNYYGYVQFIDYSKGKSKLSPVAIVSNEPNQAVFEIDGNEYYGIEDLIENVDIQNEPINLLDHCINFKELGVATASGNRVRRVPIYEPSNLFNLDIRPNSILHFKYGGEAGVVPCYENGSLLKDVKANDLIDTLF